MNTYYYVNTPSKIKSIIKKLTTDLVVEGKEEVILADTAVKLMSKNSSIIFWNCKI